MKKCKKFKKYVGLFSLLLLFLIAFFVLDYFLGYEITHNVSYGEKEANVMDVYMPKKAYKRETNGCVVFIHGGSWSGGDKKEEAARCRLLASRGYMAISVNYTLHSDATADVYSVFDVLDELDGALSAIKAFAAERGVVVDKAGITGYSAGAHLAMLYSYSRADTAPLTIAFVGSMAGPADISEQVWGSEMTIRVAKRLTGKTLTEEMLLSGEADELHQSISPGSYVNENSPPTAIMHGGKDTLVPVANTSSLVEKLSQNEVPYDYVYVKNADHLLLHNPFKHLSYYKTLIRYAKIYF
ncbi:MAG: alpha/beta hydrolase [Clostridia bacterium]|nr:alpha/beta hydrolase [Clostridia bacterium]